MNTDSEPRTHRREIYSLLCISLIALVLRVGLASFPRVIRWDEPDYLWLGKSLLMGQGYTITGVPELHYTPLLPILSGAIYALTGKPELGTSIWYVLCGAFLCVPVYAIAQRSYGRRVALISALLVAVFPSLSAGVLYWGTMTEPLFVLLVYGALWSVWVALDRRALWLYAVTGLLLGLAYLARPEGLIWAGGVGLLMLLYWGARKRLWRWRSLAKLCLYVGAFLLVAMPYMFFLHRHTGQWMGTGKLGITYDIGEAVLEGDPLLYDRVTASLDATTGEILWWSQGRFERTMLGVLMDDPAAFLTRTWRNLGQIRQVLLVPLVFPLFLLAPIVLALFKHPWTRRRLGHEALLWAGVVPLVSFLPFHIEARFFAPAFPALLIWVAAGLDEMGVWLAETLGHWRDGCGGQGGAPKTPLRRWRPIMTGLLTAMLIIYFALTQVRVVRRGMNELNYAHKQAGLWLRENSPPDAAVMTRDLAVALYAQRGFVASPRADYAEYLDYARRKGASYLLVDERELRILRPHLAFLLDDLQPPDELEPVLTLVDARGRTIVYRIKD